MRGRYHPWGCAAIGGTPPGREPAPRTREATASQSPIEFARYRPHQFRIATVRNRNKAVAERSLPMMRSSPVGVDGLKYGLPRGGVECSPRCDYGAKIVVEVRRVRQNRVAGASSGASAVIARRKSFVHPTCIYVRLHS